MQLQTQKEIDEYKNRLKTEIHDWQNIMHKIRANAPRQENWGNDKQITEIQSLIQEIHEDIEDQCFKAGYELKKIRRYDDRP